MSYINMDHAGWVQRCIDGTYSNGKPTAAETRAAKDRKGWWAAPHQLTAFQKRAFDILGIVGGGIYNAPIAWTALEWRPTHLIVPWGSHGGFGTWDFSNLTRFVFLCHEARVRGYITSGGPSHFKLHLSQRVATGDIAHRHPNLDEALADWRKEFPADHSIVYRDPPPADPYAEVRTKGDLRDFKTGDFHLDKSA